MLLLTWVFWGLAACGTLSGSCGADNGHGGLDAQVEDRPDATKEPKRDGGVATDAKVPADGGGGLCDGGPCPKDDGGANGGPDLGDACGRDLMLCGGLCVDLNSNEEHCGRCGHACQPGEECSGGSCVPICDADHALCDGRCVRPSQCFEHCGSCGTRCFPRQHCRDGICLGVGLLNPADLHQYMQRKDFLLINVGVRPEGIIPGTDISIPNEEVDRLVQFIGSNLHARVVLYCRTTPRTLDALENLHARGYTSISYLDGGVLAWRAAGYPVE